MLGIRYQGYDVRCVPNAKHSDDYVVIVTWKNGVGADHHFETPKHLINHLYQKASRSNNTCQTMVEKLEYLKKRMVILPIFQVGAFAFSLDNSIYDAKLIGYLYMEPSTIDKNFAGSLQHAKDWCLREWEIFLEMPWKCVVKTRDDGVVMQIDEFRGTFSGLNDHVKSVIDYLITLNQDPTCVK